MSFQTKPTPRSAGELHCCM